MPKIDAKSVRHGLHRELTEHKLTQMREFGDAMLVKLAGGESLTQYELDAVVEFAARVAPMRATSSNDGFVDESRPYEVRSASDPVGFRDMVEQFWHELRNPPAEVQRGGTIETVLGVSLVAESAEVVAAQDGSELTGNSDLPVDFERINL